MEILIVLAGLILVGLVVGALAGLIWGQNRPIGVKGDYLIAILAAILIGLMDWFLIPALGFSPQLKYAGVFLEPPLGALLVLWLIRLANKS